MSPLPPDSIYVEHVERNPDGTTTLFGTLPDGTKVARTFQPGEMVTRVKRTKP